MGVADGHPGRGIGEPARHTAIAPNLHFRDPRWISALHTQPQAESADNSVEFIDDSEGLAVRRIFEVAEESFHSREISAGRKSPEKQIAFPPLERHPPQGPLLGVDEFQRLAGWQFHSQHPVVSVHSAPV